MTRDLPSYELHLVQQLVLARRYRITGTALNGAGELGLDEDDVVRCIQLLESNCFYKTMPSDQRPGLWQDVYRPGFAGFDLYVKLQVVGVDPDDMLVVISFKRR